MSIEIIHEREDFEETAYWHSFLLRGEGGRGFTFDVTENDELLKPNPSAAENFRKCKDGTFDVIDEGIKSRKVRWHTVRIGRCYCGAEVALDGFTNTCDCGRDYNWAGQELAPRSQWGEETGESLADILAIP